MDSAVHEKPLILPVGWSERLIIEREVETEIPPVHRLVIRLGLESRVLRAVHPRWWRKIDSRNSLEIETFNLLSLGRCESVWELGAYREHHRHVATHVGLSLEWHAWARFNLVLGYGGRYMVRNVARHGLMDTEVRKRRSEYLGEGLRCRLLVIYRMEIPVRGAVVVGDGLELRCSHEEMNCLTDGIGDVQESLVSTVMRCDEEAKSSAWFEHRPCQSYYGLN